MWMEVQPPGRKGLVMEIKVLFTAMGSIGSRHLKNLKKIADAEHVNLIVDTLRKSDRKLPEDIRLLVRHELHQWDETDPMYDMIFVTSPTAEHFREICFFKNRTRSMFIEKPIFESTSYDLKEAMPNPDQLFYVAAPMRFTDVVQCLKQDVTKENYFAARIICSSYMPEWQKGRDYRKSFRTDVRAGGGGDIDLIHEIDYMVDLFGFPEKAVKVSGKYSDLEMSACDLAVYIFTYSHMVVEVHLDYFGRSDQRQIELFGGHETVIGDLLSKKVSYLCDKKEIQFDTSVDHYYREMRYFWDMFIDKGKTICNINPVENAFRVLKLAKGDIG